MLHATTLPSGRVEHFDKRICLGVSVPNLVQCKYISSSLPCANQWAGRVQHESTSLRCSSVEALGFSRRVLHELWRTVAEGSSPGLRRPSRRTQIPLVFINTTRQPSGSSKVTPL